MGVDLGELYREKQSDETYRDHLATVDASGKRVWVYPKKPKGRFTRYRLLVSLLLLAILFAGPFIKVNGQPFLLFNFFERKFIILGQVFWPQDFFLAVVGMITGVVFIIVFTVIFGRIFCGWICPQTIFMEFVFRQVEYWIEGDYMAQKKLDRQPWNREKLLKKGLKQLVFIAFSLLIMHTFMAYIIGAEETWRVIKAGPANAPVGFLSMIVLTGLFYGVFSSLREQVCTTICPYGRLQGVLLDKQSIVVAYDHVRGENRAKLRKHEGRSSGEKGDCIDCKQCVFVCPTGIDIRNGTQMDCVNCTACIDACDDIMDKVGKPRGLIRYASEQNIVEKLAFRFTGRMAAYSTLLLVLVGIMVSLLVLRSDVEITILRTPGMMYQEQADGRISNLYQVTMINKTNKDLPVSFELLEPAGTLKMVGNDFTLEKQGKVEGAFFVIIDPKDLTAMSSKIEIGVYSGDELIETVRTKFLGPAI